MHVCLTVLTLGIWLVCLLSSAAKCIIWPWRCEHCGWHEPDFRSPQERQESMQKKHPQAGQGRPRRNQQIAESGPRPEAPESSES